MDELDEALLGEVLDGLLDGMLGWAAEQTLAGLERAIPTEEVERRLRELHAARG